MSTSCIVIFQEFFPNNWLRQIALDQARTKHVLLFDIDLIPSKSLYPNLLAIKENYIKIKKVGELNQLFKCRNGFLLRFLFLENLHFVCVRLKIVPNVSTINN